MSQTKAQLISDLVQALNFTGTASAPANGAFLSATNTLALATNSAQRLTIDSSGHVGIGTTSPVGRLHVHNAGTGSGDHAYAFFTTGDTGSSSSDGLTVGVAATQVAFINFREANDLVISTTSTERMRIKANGNVGINNTNPDRKLEVQNDGDYAAKFSGGSGAGHTSIEIGQVATNGSSGFNATGGSMLFDIAGTEKMRLNTSGQLGIGTSSPNRHLHLHQSDSTGSSVRFTNSTTGSGENDGLTVGINGSEQAEFWQRENTAMVFGTNNAERMRIDSSGNVGINQVPTRELSLHSPNNNNALIHFTNDDTGETSADGILVGLDGNENMVINNQETGKTINFYNGGSERVRIDSDGRLQIGSTNNSSTGTKLVVGSGNNLAATALINTQDTDINALTLSNWDGATTSNKVLIGFDSSGRGAFSLGMPAATNALAFFGSIDGSSNERMRIDSSGNVGIGLTNPGTKLDVGGAGTFRVANSTSYQAAFNATNAVTTDFQIWVKNNNIALGPSTASDIHFVTQGNGNTRMIVQDNGNVGIGTAAPGAKLELYAANNGVTDPLAANQRIRFRDNDSTGTTGQPMGTLEWYSNDSSRQGISAYMTVLHDGTTGNGKFSFGMANGGAPAERVVFKADGKVGISSSPARMLAVAVPSTQGNIGCVEFANNKTDNAAAIMFVSTLREPSSSESFLQCNKDQNNDGSGAAATFFIRTNGDCDSATNSYGGISDITLKENIVDAKSQWDDIKNIKVRNFNFKDNPSQKMLGVVAQEVETVSAGLVKDCPDENITSPGPEGTSTKSVKYSILYMKAIKALQEAMTRIETLETEVAALKAA